MSAHAAAERHSAQVARATAAEWATEEARAEAEQQVVTFARRAAAAKRMAMRLSNGATTATVGRRHRTRRHSFASEAEIQARLHGLRIAEQAAVMAHSRKLALKLEFQ